MDFEKLMRKKISRKDFLKSFGFILMALVLFPRKALSFMDDSLSGVKNGVEVENVSSLKEIHLNGVKVIEIVEE